MSTSAEPANLMEALVSLAKRRGIIYPSSEIYGGLNGFFDYGPVGAELKRNIRDCWWRDMVQRRDDIVGIETSIIMHPKVWEASGHVAGFTDPLVDCKVSKQRFRADQLFFAAVLVEPIQGEAGIQIPDDGYLASLRRLCDQHGWLLIFDEIQSGLCRTGRWYAHQHEQAVPDILTTAKALANGFPIGACIARGKTADLLTPGRHGSTFGGNPLACRTACAVLGVMEQEGLAARAEQLLSALDTPRPRVSLSAQRQGVA